MFDTLGEFRQQLHLRLLEIDDNATAHPVARLNAACNKALDILARQFMAVPFVRSVSVAANAVSVPAAFTDGGYTFSLVELAWARFTQTGSSTVYDLVLVGNDELPAANAAVVPSGIPRYIAWARNVLAGPTVQNVLVLHPPPAFAGTLTFYGAYGHPRLSLDTDRVFIAADYRDAALDLALAYVYEATDTQPRNHLIELAYDKARRAQYHLMRRESWYKSQRKVLKGRSL